MPRSTSGRKQRESVGRLRIGDDWNAIHIIALSQSNPLKAVAEFVENAIDARATSITIIRGRERGETYLKIIDDGEGVPLGDDGRPNFKHVATHICDSLKRHMKASGAHGVQGEFGIGLLSFWTVGETLSMVSAGDDGQTYEMRMAKDDPNYSVSRLRRLVPQAGTELTIRPLLSGIRQFSGEKLQWYLASELRDRIRRNNVEITVVDRQARAEYRVEPREFTGQLLHHLPTPATPFGDLYVELYLAEPATENRVSLYRAGTRVLESIAELPQLAHEPWTTGAVQGVIDAPFLNLTPGTRLGVIHDDRLAALAAALDELAATVTEVIQQRQRAAEERTNRDTLQSIQRAFREALLALPQEEYDWFAGYGVAGERNPRPVAGGDRRPLAGAMEGGAEEDSPPAETAPPAQREFFEHPGPLHSVRISPATCVVSIGKTKRLRAVPRDRGGKQVEHEVEFAWRLVEGEATLADVDREIVALTAPDEPQLIRLAVSASQDQRQVEAEALVTVTDSLLPNRPKSEAQRRLAGVHV